jgi:hypothetical protein
VSCIVFGRRPAVTIELFQSTKFSARQSVSITVAQISFQLANHPRLFVLRLGDWSPLRCPAIHELFEHDWLPRHDRQLCHGS